MLSFQSFPDSIQLFSASVRSLPGGDPEPRGLLDSTRRHYRTKDILFTTTSEFSLRIAGPSRRRTHGNTLNAFGASTEWILVVQNDLVSSLHLSRSFAAETVAIPAHKLPSRQFLDWISNFTLESANKNCHNCRNWQDSRSQFPPREVLLWAQQALGSPIYAIS